MFDPYARIIPMHTITVIGSTFAGALPFFLILKTIADLAMHANEHKLRKAEVQEL